MQLQGRARQTFSSIIFINTKNANLRIQYLRKSKHSSSSATLKLAISRVYFGGAYSKIYLNKADSITFSIVSTSYTSIYPGRYVERFASYILGSTKVTTGVLSDPSVIKLMAMHPVALADCI
jgi:hypothetical protein